MDIQAIIDTVLPIVTVIGWALLAYTLLLWGASVLWVYRDIARRSEDTLAQVLALLLAVLLPFAGVILHLIVRPPQTLSEKYERALEADYLRRDLDEQDVCPTCARAIEAEFVVCPHCRTALRRRCHSCDRVIDLTWAICPYCADDGIGLATQNARRATDQFAVVDR